MPDQPVPPGNTTTLDGIVVTLHISTIDGSPVVQIETDDYTGALRVYLNDGALWDGNPETHDHEDCSCIGRWNDAAAALARAMS